MDYEKEYELLKAQYDEMILDIEDYKKDTAVTALLLSPSWEIRSCLDHLSKWGIEISIDSPFVVIGMSSDKNFRTPPRANLSTYKIVSDHHRWLRSQIFSILGKCFDIKVINMPKHLFGIIDLKNYSDCFEEAIKLLKNAVDELNDSIDNELINVDISRVWYGAEGLSKAYEDCIDVYRIRGIMGSFAPHYICYTDISRLPVATPEVDQNFITEFRRKTFSGDYVGAEKCLREYISSLFSDGSDALNMMLEVLFNRIKSCVLDIIADVFVCGKYNCEKLNLNHSGEFLARASSFDEVLDAYRSFFESFTTVCSACEAGQLPLAERIRLYIDDCYTSADLNVNLIATHFDRTPSYTGKIFKNRFGFSILDYIQKKRVDAVKYYLGTNKTVKQIAVITGFENSQNLIRVYKKIEGTTPGCEK